MKVHLMGVCGSGMSGLALWYRALGHQVSGCDGSPSPDKTISLKAAGVEVFDHHSPAHLEGVDRLVFTAAVPQGNQELEAARKSGITVLRRSEALAELALSHDVVAVSGAHGKTTTTSMTGWIAQECGANPTVFVGGHMDCWGGNFRSGGKLAVVESDEYDRTFLRLTPAHAAVTSYALEHLECYGSPEALEWAFQAFLESVLPGGTVIVPMEKPALGYWAARIGRKVLRSGPGGEIDAKMGEYPGWGEKYTLFGCRGFIPAPGVHNVRNAQIAVALSQAVGIEPSEAVAALESWPGVSRRLEKIASRGDTVFVSDYAHHPDEMAAALSSLENSVTGPVTVFFQPHLYSRTSLLHREMGIALGIAAKSFVLPVYPAREEPLHGVDSSLVVKAAVKAGADCTAIEMEEMESALNGIEGGIVVFMGAGSIDSRARSILGVR